MDPAVPTGSEFHVGDRHYRLLQTIGRGGFGTVYRARLSSGAGFEKDVAVKVLHLQGQSVDDMTCRIRDEARVLAALRHRAIVGVEDLLQLDGRWAVVMELVEGADLSALMRLGPMPARPAAELGCEIAAALFAAHTARAPDTGQPMHVVHRDIKPANIRLAPTGDVKVMDFGVARATFEQRESRTDSLSFGSWGYMAPERFDELETPASDVYALGAVLLECLLGTRVKQLSVNPLRHRRAVERALSRLSSDPPAFPQLIAQMLAYEPERRPTMDEIADALRGLLPILPGPWLREWAPAALKRLADEEPSSVVLVAPVRPVGAPPPPPRVPRPGASAPVDPTAAPDPAALPGPPPPMPAQEARRVIDVLPDFDPDDDDPLTPGGLAALRPPPPLVAPDSGPTGVREAPVAAPIAPTADEDPRAAPPLPEPQPFEPTEEDPAPAAPILWSRRAAPLIALLGFALVLGVGARWLRAPVPPDPAPDPSAPEAPPPTPVVTQTARTEDAPQPAAIPATAAPPRPTLARAVAPAPAAQATQAVPPPESASAADPAPQAQAPEPPLDEPAASPSAATPELSGAWRGESQGRPMSLSLQFGSAGEVSGVIRLRLGPQEVASRVSGSYTLEPDGTGSISLSEPGNPRAAVYRGAISGQTIRGQVVLGDRPRGEWSASR